MKRTLFLFSMLALIAVMAGQVQAGTDIKTSGQIRLRCELDGKSFNKDDVMRQYSFLRTRINIDAKINDNVKAFIQFQNSRQLGHPKSGDLNDRGHVGVHQAFFQVDNLWDNGPGIKAGRFEVNLGGQRVFGAVGWHNVGRSWEGCQMWKEFNNTKITGYCLRKIEVDDHTRNSDFDIFGIHADISSANLELFGFLENNAGLLVLNDFGGAWLSDYNALQRINLGLHYKRTHNQFDFELNGLYQIGKKQMEHLNVEGIDSSWIFDEIDIAAFMFAFEAGYSFDSPIKPRLAIGVDYTSGDDNATDDKYKAYDNLYYTGHKYRGYMDYFINSEDAGLMDIMLRGQLTLFEGWVVKGDIHLFSTTADYASEIDGSDTKDVGMEFDFSVATKKISGTKWVNGLSLFMPKKDFSGENDDMTIWAYTMFIVGF